MYVCVTLYIYKIIYIYTYTWGLHCVVMILHLGDGPPGEWPGQAHPIGAAKEASQHSWSRYFQDSPGPPYLSGSVMTHHDTIKADIKADLGTCGQRPWRWERNCLTSQSSSKHGNEQTPQNIPTKQPSAQPNDLSNCQPTSEGTQNTAIQDRKETNQKRLQWATRRINQTHTHNLSKSASKQ